ncbi:MAG: hypothetical protein V4710_04545 [Verrucomicrobiota bacterium]
MPQRPSKKKDPKRNPNPSATGDADQRKLTDERRRDFNTKSILNKFQGRKSI